MVHSKDNWHGLLFILGDTASQTAACCCLLGCGAQGASGGRHVQTACTLCTLCTLFKTGRTTENKTSEFRSRKIGDGVKPFISRVIGREIVKLGQKGGVFNVLKTCACTQKKCAHCVHVLQVRIFVQGFYQGNEFRSMCMTFLLFQNTVCLKPF